ncbi:MAG: M48 family metallopeptidase [Flavobacteriales bacterium]|nr:M48 family metallopeptidase [Flavobacteriales bacterium]
MPRLFVTVLLFLPVLLCAQHLDDYSFLRSSGNIPPDFFKSAEKKFYDNRFRILYNTKYKNRSQAEAYLRQSYFYVSELLQSGVVVFNDPISAYAKLVLNELFKDSAHIIENVRIYTVKSNQVNAYTSNDGIIFLTTGLIAKLENEAQLASILAHEVTHHHKRHIIKGYINTAKVNKKSNYNRTSISDRLFAISSYSRKLEFEADSFGGTIFLNSRYKKSEMISSLKLLTLYHTPFTNADFDPSALLPHGTKLDPAISDSTYALAPHISTDGLGTHPSIDLRIAAAERQSERVQKDDGAYYLVSESEFEKIRDIARFETIHIALIKNRVAHCIYLSSYMLNKYPDNSFLHQSIMNALYLRATQGMAGSSVENYNIGKDEGNVFKAATFLSLYSRAQYNVMALQYCEGILAPGKLGLVRELVLDLVADHSIYPGDSLVQYQREYIRKSSDQMALLFKEANEKLLTDAHIGVGDAGYFLQKKPKYKLFNKRKYDDPINILFVNPTLIDLDERTMSVNVTGNQARITKFNEVLTKNSSILGMKGIVLQAKNLTDTSTKAFNDLIAINEWMRHMDRNLIRYNGVNYSDIQRIMKEYHVEIICDVGFVSVRMDRPYLAKVVLYGGVNFLAPIFIPLCLYDLFVPNYVSYQFSRAFNLRTSKQILWSEKFMRMKSHRTLHASRTYHELYKLRRKITAEL